MTINRTSAVQGKATKRTPFNINQDRVDIILRDPARLAALRAMCVDGVPSGPVFDRMTRLAARLLNAPVAIGTIVDFDRQILASAFDPDERYVTGNEAGIEYSFCQYTVANASAFAVSDNRQMPLLAGSPAVTENGVLSYAGIPLMVGGQALGALCVLDYVPRQWTPEQIEVLEDLAAGAATELELRNALGEAEARAQAETAVRRLEAVQKVNDVALRDLSIEALFEKLLDRVQESFDADTATLLLLDPVSGHLVVKASIGATIDGSTQPDHRRGDGKRNQVHGFRWVGIGFSLFRRGFRARGDHGHRRRNSGHKTDRYFLDVRAARSVHHPSSRRARPRTGNQPRTGACNER